MSWHPPGDKGRDGWSASIPSSDLDLDLFTSHNLRIIPVALVSSSEGSLPAKNPKLLQNYLRLTSSHFKEITEVRPYGKTGIILKSASIDCVRDLLACTTFGSVPVSAFIPSHLACVKGVVRDVDCSLSPAEVLELFSPAGAVSVFRCSRLLDNKRVPTNSVIVTFLGLSRPTEVKAWPLIYRVDPFNRRPTQCRHCWRFGHVEKNCRSGIRCRVCGASHLASECTEKVPSCCLCSNSHMADSSDCPFRSHETDVIAAMDRCHCSRAEAQAMVKPHNASFSDTVKRSAAPLDCDFPKMIDAAVEKAIARILDPVLSTLSSTLSQLNQLISEKMDAVLRTFAPLTTMFVAPSILASSLGTVVSPIPPTPDKAVSPSEQILPSQTSDDMECSTASIKRSASPASDSSPRLNRQTKRKESSQSKRKGDILQEAVSAIELHQ